MPSRAKAWSRVFVEEAVRDAPLAQGLLRRLPKARVVMIDHYQNVLGRGGQDFWAQKRSPALVLAAARPPFLYKGNDFLQSAVAPNFRYTTPVLNCPYDCHYCYLQGLLAGANPVVFVNTEDYFRAVESELAALSAGTEPLHLALSYDTDLLALEGLFGLGAAWTEAFRGREGVRVEIRTKSAPMRFLRETVPHGGVRLAWTLSPEPVARRYESGAPSLERRIAAMRAAAGAGWRLHLCLDPLLRLPGWEYMYEAFMDRLRSALPWNAIERVEIGVFRVSPDHFRRMRNRPGTDLLHYPYEHATTAVSYREEERHEMMEFVRKRLPESLSQQHILLWT